MAVADVLPALPYTSQNAMSNAAKPSFMASKFAPEPWLPSQPKDDSRPSTASSFVTARPDSPKHDLLDAEPDVALTLGHEHPSPPPSLAPVEPDWLARLDKLPTSIPTSTSATTDRLTTRRPPESAAFPSPPSTKSNSSHAPEWTPTRTNGTVNHDGASSTSEYASSVSQTREQPSLALNGHSHDHPSTLVNGTHDLPSSLRPGYSSVKAPAAPPADNNTGAQRAEAPQFSPVAPASTSYGQANGAAHASISNSDPTTRDSACASISTSAACSGAVLSYLHQATESARCIWKAVSLTSAHARARVWLATGA
ncbi:hypothetical protein PENSPDRAFT_339259 [Peniophora sp. CONT]|nr:hypothetical protein PENSPDRAFT_339259 [Peniophora sp. CONT]